MTHLKTIFINFETLCKGVSDFLSVTIIFHFTHLHNLLLAWCFIKFFIQGQQDNVRIVRLLDKRLGSKLWVHKIVILSKAEIPFLIWENNFHIVVEKKLESAMKFPKKAFAIKIDAKINSPFDLMLPWW